ncbi:MAG TPA: S26 family signal peptidase [Planctomycetota bacterium]|nr:S26 family signal peptidase [Planctomycetota bacterium]
MQYVITLGLQLLPFIIVIIVCIIARKVLSRFIGETHPINAYVLVIVPIMSVLIGFYLVARPMFVGQRAVVVEANTQMGIASGSYNIDESWREEGIKAFKVGDVIAYKNGNRKAAYESTSSVSTLQVGRVVGLPGNRLEAYSIEKSGSHDFGLVIDGNKITNEILPSTDFSGINDVRYGLTVPEGSLWVVIDKGRRMGAFETDSPYVGPIREAQIVGKIRAWSEKDFGALVENKK